MGRPRGRAGRRWPGAWPAGWLVPVLVLALALVGPVAAQPDPGSAPAPTPAPAQADPGSAPEPAPAPATSAAAIVPTARLSAEQVAAGDTLTLTLTLPPAAAPGGAPFLAPAAAGAGPLPDLTPLQADFHLVGQTVRETAAGRELQLTLLPRRSGRLTVPALAIGNARTGALTLTVAATTTTGSQLLPAPAGLTPGRADAGVDAPPDLASGGPVEVSAVASPDEVRVGQQLLLVVSVRDGAPPRGLLAPLTGIGAEVLILGEDRRREPAAAGRPAREVFERRLALFPRSVGTLLIPALTYQDDAGRRGTSAAMTVRVLPRPADAGPGPWLPARAVSLGEAGPARIRMAPGQALERLVTLRAEGLPAEALPPVPLAIPAALKLGEDPPRLWNERRPDGVVGHRTERVLISALSVGEYLLRTAPLRWWNTDRRDWASATLPDWSLTVAPFASADRRETPTWRPEGLGPMLSQPPDGPPAHSRPWWSRWWVWVGALLALAVAGGLWWRRHRPGPPGDPA